MPADPLKVGKDWFSEAGWEPFAFQIEAWEACMKGLSGLVNAPTGSGKTYSLMVPLVLQFLHDYPAAKARKNAGLQAIWITPIRALSKEIELSARRLIDGLGIDMTVGVRSGDTSLKERMRQKTKPPHLLITTPESLHLLLAQKAYPALFNDLKILIADEWHELIGSKRGAHLSLSLERLAALCERPLVRIGLSATSNPVSLMAQFLTGCRPGRCAIVDTGHARERDLALELPSSPLEPVMAAEVWTEIYDRLAELARAHRTTLIFVNQRQGVTENYRRYLYNGLRAHWGFHGTPVRLKFRSRREAER